MLYLWIKALHLISLISWMAALFYLPRLFVYHAENITDDGKYQLFLVMERRLIKFIMSPAMMASWLFGLTLMVLGNWHTAPWFHAKLLLVVLLTVFHVVLTRYHKAFVAGSCQKDGRFFRIINEIPTLLMIGIVLLVVLKPF